MTRIVDQRIKDKLIEKWRDCYVNGNWWADVYEDTKQRMKLKGFDADDFAFTGFWCQGDGASFVGDVVDWSLFWKQFNADTYPTMRKALEAGHCMAFTVTRRGNRYVHEYCADGDVEYESFSECRKDDDDFLNDVRALWDSMLEKEVEEFRKEANELVRADMREMYRDLEKEYDHLTSDEVVWDWLLDHPFLDAEIASIDED
jgi:hypothetical protein